MNYDEWFEDSADDLGLHGLKATARMVWDAAIAAERDQVANDRALLHWLLEHPETAAECLNDAAAGDGEARANLEGRMDDLKRSKGNDDEL